MRERQLQMLNADRQKSMVANTNKLLKLATELNAEVNGAHAGVLTKEQLSKVNEIEKLARKVREEMSLSVKRAPIMQPSPIPPFFQ